MIMLMVILSKVTVTCFQQWITSGREDQGLSAAQRDVKISNQYSFIPPFLQIEERRGCVSPSLLFQGVNVESNRFKSFH